jgi:hypothetical protein
MLCRKSASAVFTALVFAGVTLVGQPVIAQEATDATAIASEKEHLKDVAKRPEVIEELEEPDGVSIDDSETDNWKIIALGTGTYDFNDAEERKDALEEAVLTAKAALAKFAKERLSSQSQIDILAERESKKSRNGDAKEKSNTEHRIKTNLSSIHNSADDILSGVLTLETTAKWDGDSGEMRVKIGQSAKSLAAAEKFRTRTGQSVARGDREGAKAAESANKSRADGPSTIKRKSKTSF